MKTTGTNIFTYGSLMFRQVWEHVVRVRYRSSAADAPGYARYAIPGQTYPGMVKQADVSVQGVLYFDVTDADITLLDAFEGCDYRRDCLHVVLDDGTRAAAAAYIYTGTIGLSDTAWRPEAFQIDDFLNTYCRDKPDKS